MDRALTATRCAMAQNAPSGRRYLIQGRAVGPKMLLLCAVVMGLGVSVGWGLPVVPDTILLPDSLGPLRPGYHLAFGSSTDNIYVASESSDIIVVDGETFQRIKRINTGTPVGGAVLVSRHNRLYCSYPLQGRIGVIDCATNSIIRTIQVGTRPTLLDYSSGSDKLYCGDTIDRTITVIDCAADTVRKVISVGTGLAAMTHDPTTNKMYAATRAAVLAISCSADSIVATISSVREARCLCVNKSRQKVYVTTTTYAGLDTVFVISTKTDCVAARMKGMSFPQPVLACNEGTDRLYSVSDLGDVLEFDCVGDTLIRFEPLRLYAEAIGLFCDSVRNRLYYLYVRNAVGFLVVLDCATLDVISETPVFYLVYHPVVRSAPVLQADPARFRIICAGGGWEEAALTVFDYKGDNSYARGAVPLSGWKRVMCHNSASGKLYYWWGSGVGGLGVIDERTDRLVAQVFLSQARAREQAYSRTSNKLYFNALGKGLGVMDGTRDSLIKVIEMVAPAMGIRPCWCADVNKVYCAASKGARRYVAVVDCYTDSVVREIDIYDTFMSFECLGDGRLLCRQLRRFTLIDSRADTVQVDSAVEQSEYRAFAHTKDGEKVYIAFNGKLEVLSSRTLALLATIYWPYAGHIGGGGTLICSDAARKIYWFSDNADSTLAIDTRGDTVVARMPLSGCRVLSCLDRTGRYLFCFANYVRVYDTRTDSLVAVRPTPFPAVSVTPNPELGCIYVGCEDVILVYSDVPPGVQEMPNAEVRMASAGPTVVRGVLVLGAVDSRQHTAYKAELLDVGGRKVMELKPGANDVRDLPPGVYFIRERQQAASSRPQAVCKVVITR
jgi:DNA-binding beta-propeller fold protein YncE